MTVKIAMLAPRPSARQSRAMRVKPGLLRSERTASRMSLMTVSILSYPLQSDVYQSAAIRVTPRARRNVDVDRLAIATHGAHSLLSAVIGSTFVARRAGT